MNLNTVKEMAKERKEKDRLIPLNCADQCLLALASIGECQRHHWILDVDGDIDCKRLEKALLYVLKVYPSMCSRLSVSSWKIRRKCIDSDIPRPVQFLDLDEQHKNPDTKDTYIEKLCDEAIVEWRKRPFVLTEEIPIRVLLIRIRQDKHKIVFTFPHSSIDGRRTVIFLQRVFEAYNGDALAEPFLFTFFRQRKGDELLAFARAKRSEVRSFYRKIFFSLLHRFFIEPLHPPSRVFHDISDDSSDLDYCFEIIDSDELMDIRKAAKANNHKVNDLLLGACFMAIDRWNNAHGRSCSKIRIMVPVDIAASDSKDLISNQVGFLSLSTMPKDRADHGALLQKVNTMMSSMLRDGIAFSIVYFCYLGRFFPWIITRAIAKFLIVTRVYLDTVVLTNLGPIDTNEGTGFSLDSSKISSINIVGPIATPMGLIIIMYTYANKLYVSITYKTSLFSKDRIRKFLDTYLAELRSYITRYEFAVPVYPAQKVASVHE